MHRRTRTRATALGVGIILALGSVTGGAQAALADTGVPATVDLCAVPEPVGEYSDGIDNAEVRVLYTNPTTCLRTYRLTSDRGVSKQFSETAGDPILRTGSAVLDGMYAFALHEEKLLQRDQINTGNYNHGASIDCNPAGIPTEERVGCYITGKNWSYIWTRDLAYAADLGLAAIDPIRMRNTLDFKLSERRTDGVAGGGGLTGDLQVIQDTGTGGSYPNSTDRVSWAVGADELLKWLPSPQREDFAARSLEALKNTIDHDRQVVFNPKTGLYSGETSFLDWRQQTYPSWTYADVTHIATSESLSTNITHWAAIDLVSRLSAEAGNDADAAKYRGWADDLAQDLRDNLWLEDRQQFSAVLSNTLNLAPTERFDALATSFAVLNDIATPEQAKAAVANYPQTFTGPSVIWPQQDGPGSYHNEGVWPFVTAYVLRAAAKVGNDTSVTRQYESMLRTAAIFGSNYENMNILTTETNTRLNSEYQTWSVAGSIGMINDVMFGINAQHDGLSFAPYLTAQMRSKYLQGVDKITLSNVAYRGKTISIVLDLPNDTATKGSYHASAIKVDGAAVALDAVVPESTFNANSVVEVTLGAVSPSVGAAPISDTTNHEAIYGPKTPGFQQDPTRVAGNGGMKLDLSFAGEDKSRMTMDIIRDGELIAEGLPAADSWTDTTATASDKVSYCYSVRTEYKSSKNASQDADPKCYWGDAYERITTVQAAQFVDVIANGEPASGETSRYEDWGTNTLDTITAKMTPTTTGIYLIQAEYAKGNDLRNGVDSGIKQVTVTEDGTGDEVGSSIVFMPRTYVDPSEGGTVDNWMSRKGSTFAQVHLEAGKTYSVRIHHDPLAINMSYFEANKWHNEQTGGASNFIDIFSVSALLKKATDGDLAATIVAPKSNVDAEVGQTVTVVADLTGSNAAAQQDFTSKAFDFGDGTTKTAVITQNADGAGFFATATHTYTGAGTYLVAGTFKTANSSNTVVTHNVTVREIPTGVLAPAAPNGNAGWFKTKPTVTIAAPGSAATQARVGDGAWAPYTAPVAVAVEGASTVQARTTAASGRVGETHDVASVKVDTVAPVASGTATAAGKNASIALAATDATSGVAKVEYQLPGQSAWQVYAAPVQVELKATAQNVAVRATDVAGNTGAVVQVATGTTTAPPPASQKAGNVTITGSVRVGKTLTAKTSSWANGASLSYQWRASGKAIKGATKRTLRLTNKLRGKKLTVVVTSRLAGHTDATKTAAAKKWRVVRGKVSITGKKRVGARLTAKTSGWGPKGTKLSYRWFANGKAIKGATKKRLTLKKSQRGKRVTVRVTGKQKGFVSAKRTSKAVRIAR